MPHCERQRQSRTGVGLPPREAIPARKRLGRGGPDHTFCRWPSVTRWSFVPRRLDLHRAATVVDRAPFAVPFWTNETSTLLTELVRSTTSFSASASILRACRRDCPRTGRTSRVRLPLFEKTEARRTKGVCRPRAPAPRADCRCAQRAFPRAGCSIWRGTGPSVGGSTNDGRRASARYRARTSARVCSFAI